MPITCSVEVINWKKSVAIILDKDKETFIMQMTFFFFADNHHKALQALFFADEAFVIMLLEYSKLAIIFSPESAAKLSKYISINNYVIDLVEGQ